MKQTVLVVHCVFPEGETNLSELLEESFRLYLRRILTEEQEHLGVHP